MDNSVEIYIKSGIDTDTQSFPYERLELFESETMKLKAKIQDIKDISKVFTDFSKEFSVPASPKNNRIFKHYYDFRIQNGFDARFKMDGFIKINGIDYKKGKIVLNSVSLDKRSPKIYKIVFYGETVSLEDIIGDDELNNLGFNSTTNLPTDVFSKLSFVHTPSYVETALQDGYYFDSNWDLQPSTLPTDPIDFCFPFISAQNYYFYDSAVPAVSPTEVSTESRNIKSSASTDTTPRGINWLDLKPSVSVRTVMKAIEERYDIKFSRQEFLNDLNLPYSKLHLWMHRERGYIKEQLNKEVNSYNLGDFTPNNGLGNNLLYLDGDLIRFVNENETNYVLATRMWVTVTPTTANATYDIVVSGNGVTEEGDTISMPTQTQTCQGASLMEVIFDKPDGDITQFAIYTPKIEVVGAGGISDYTISLQLKQYIDLGGFGQVYEDYYFDVISGQNFPSAGSVDISSQMPKIKVLDFITSIFKMYNLTAYYEDGEIMIETLDNYYSKGKRYDISKYIDTSTGVVKKGKLYSEVDMSFSEPKTFAIINSNEITGDEFGNEKLRDVFANLNLRNQLNFDGGKYEVKPKFERMQFERMTAQDTEVLTEVQWGWSVNEDQRPVIGKPILFYPEKHSLSTFPTSISFDRGLYKDFDVNQLVDITKYIKPANVEVETNKTIHYGSEINEWDGTYLGESLVNEYWLNYILTLYDKSSRVFELKAILPTHLIITLKLNDVVIIDNIEYRINEMDINLNKGTVDFQLFNDLGYYD